MTQKDKTSIYKLYDLYFNKNINFREFRKEVMEIIAKKANVSEVKKMLDIVLDSK